WFLSAGILGLAFVAKYSAVLLIPTMVLTAAVRAWAPTPLVFGTKPFNSRGGKFLAAAVSAFGHMLVGALVVLAFYGVRYKGFNPALPEADNFIRPWVDYVGKTGILGEAARWAAKLRLLPEAFLFGFDFVLANAAERAGFLNGYYSSSGWPGFFLWTFALK